ncbi:MAG: HD domain-containing protein [Candidatus Eremiobacteraeota bacterium]|nr:HD domain-containing protein [Candidatus Eremiobacteraeota bacterium]
MELDERVIKMLVDEKIVEKKALIPVFKIHKTNKEPLEKLVVKLNIADKEKVLDIKTRVYGGEPLLLDNEKIDIETAKTIPQAMAKRYNLICLEKTDEGQVLIAMHNPGDSFALEYVQMRTGIKDMKIYTALLSDLEDAWDFVYTEKSKHHPFFKKKPERTRIIRKIPKKLELPGYKTFLRDKIESTTVIGGNKKTEITPPEEALNGDKLKTMTESIKKELNILSILSHSANVLNSTMDGEDIILELLETASRICNSQGASILILEDKILYFKEAVGEKSNELKLLQLPLNEKSIAGWVAIHKKPLLVNDTLNEPMHYKGVDEALHFTTTNVACVPLLWGTDVLGVMEVVNKTEGQFDDKDLEYLIILASQASVALHNASLLDQFHNFYLEVVEILIDCLESLDPVGRDHALRVARLTSAMAKQIPVTEEEYESLCYAAFLHDIGKIKCEDENDMQSHAEKGAQILSHIKFFNSIIPLIKYHHEKYDGTGIPEGLSGEKIPLGARILAVAEGYYEGRNMNPDLSGEEFLESFKEEFGIAYDPDLKEIFLNSIE